MKHEGQHWQGTPFEDLKVMPKGVKRNAGYQLHRIQVGLEPTDWKPMKSIGAGVREIRIRHTVPVNTELFM